MYATDGALHLHRPFLDRLAQKKPDAACSLAAFLLLNVVDGMRHPAYDADSLELRLNAAYSPLATAPEHDPQVRHLVRLAETLKEALSTRRNNPIIPALLQYADWLTRDARLSEGLEVLNTSDYVLEAGRMGHKGHVAQRRGLALRSLGRYGEAEAAFRLGADQAQRANDRRLYLRCRNGLAQVRTYQGRLRDSESLLVEIIKHAPGNEFDHERACATHDLAIAVRSNTTRALGLVADAYVHYQSESARRRARSDLCYFLIESGHFQAAKRCADRARSETEGPSFRVIALENEIRIASYLADPRSFDDARREFDMIDRTLPPVSLADIKVRIGQGLLFFGKRREARAMLDESISIASAAQHRGAEREARKTLRVLKGDLQMDDIRIRPAEKPVQQFLSREKFDAVKTMFQESDVMCIS